LGDDLNADKLITLIKDTVEPSSWSDNGGRGTIDYFPLGSSLVIEQTEDCHKAVQQLLASLWNTKEQARLKGTWISISWGEAGRKAPGGKADDYEVIFGDGVMTIRNQQDRQAVTYRWSVDRTHYPKAINLEHSVRSGGAFTSSTGMN
jgi:hypothetical protein